MLEALRELPANDNKLVVLVELKQSQWFGQLAQMLAKGSYGEHTKIDEVSLRLGPTDTANTLFVKAEQVNSSERIEVIVVGSEKPIPEGKPLAYYVEEYGSDFLVILPWGVGKWLGKRGALVASLVSKGGKFVLGDNGGRPAWWSVPLFASAASKGIPVVRGSDPLPVSSYAKRVLGYGDIVDVVFDSTTDWVDYVKADAMPAGKSFGRLSLGFNVLVDQIGLRKAKHFPS